MFRAARFRRLLALALAMLAACDGYRSVEPPPPPPRPGTPVSGRVVDSNGLPVPDVRVAAGAAGGWESAGTTDTDGGFTLTVTGVPYDLAAVDHSPGTIVRVYQGVTRTDPTVLFDYGGRAPPSMKVGRIEGTIAAPCTGAGCIAVGGLAAFVPGPNGLAFLTLPTYYAWASWIGPDLMSGKVLALTWSDFNQGPLAYWCASLAVDAVAGTTVRANLPAVGPCPTAPFTAAVTAPTGASFTRLYLAHSTALGWPSMVALTAAPPSATFTADIPTGQDFSSSVSWEGLNAAGGWFNVGANRITGGMADVALVVPPAPALLAPADGATGAGPGTRFAWSPAIGVPHVLVVYPVQLVTTASAARLPDLAALGAAYPTIPISWHVKADGTFADVDAYLSPIPAGIQRWAWSNSAPRQVSFR